VHFDEKENFRFVGPQPRLRIDFTSRLDVWLGVRAESRFPFFILGNLVASRSVYDDNTNNVQVGETLPPNCTGGCSKAIDDGVYPQVFNNG